MSTGARELNLDGLPGPTHNYAGLSPGNLASQQHRHHGSNPRAAALEGLAKMKMLADLGVSQAVLPPHDRPNLAMLHALGFQGAPEHVLAQAQRDAPELLAAACSASSMWAANAATVCPSADSSDGRVHFTPANLVSELHRSIEHETTRALLERIFPEPAVFAHHAPLPAAMGLRDEGAANHVRLCRDYDERGVQMFVYGVHGIGRDSHGPRTYLARQTREASEAVARLHGIDAKRVCFVRQHPDAIDAGVFHNDVAAVGDRDVLFYHADAFVDTARVVDGLSQRFSQTCGGELRRVEVSRQSVSLEEAVRTYLFNSQLVRSGDGATVLVAPRQCQESESVRACLASWVGQGRPFQAVRYVDLLQSMRNGGGPACLRLRVALSEAELGKVHPGVMLDETLYAQLVQWVRGHYRDGLRPADLADPDLLTEARTALDELTQLLNLGSIYAFQQVRAGGSARQRGDKDARTGPHWLGR